MLLGAERRAGFRHVEAPGQPSGVEAHPTLEYKNIKGDTTYVEVPWLWRPLGNCPTCPVLNPVLTERNSMVEILTRCDRLSDLQLLVDPYMYFVFSQCSTTYVINVMVSRSSNKTFPSLYFLFHAVLSYSCGGGGGGGVCFVFCFLFVGFVGFFSCFICNLVCVCVCVCARARACSD